MIHTLTRSHTYDNRLAVRASYPHAAIIRPYRDVFVVFDTAEEAIGHETTMAIKRREMGA